MVLGMVGARGVIVNASVELKQNIAAVTVVTLILTAKEMVVKGLIVNLPAVQILAVSRNFFSLVMHR